jgi:hypothetical protein
MKRKAVIFLLAFTIQVLQAPAQDKRFVSKPTSKTDSVLTYASSLYKPNSFLRTLFLGKNYRDEWKQLVTVPVFRLTGSGFTIRELGGGMQTKSLKLSDRLGKEWALRTVDKDVSNAGVAALRFPLGQKIAQDMISSAFPYGGVLAGELARAIGLKAATPQVFFVADDPALGQFRSIFAHTLCTLEERDPDFPDTDDSEKTLSNLTESNRYKIQQPFLLKARLLDILIGDWDRHADNWRWGQVDSAGFDYYYAIPRDRDWAFYKSGGLLPKLVQVTGALRYFISFGPNLKNVKDLSWKAWTLDKTFLNEMDASHWRAAIHEVQAILTDKLIDSLVKKLPASIYRTQGEWLANSLKTRRNNMQKEVMKYYRFLAEEPMVNGSNEAERFVVAGTDDGLTVAVYGGHTQQRQLYKRRFFSSETYAIILNGAGGADVFEVDESARARIRLIINGNEGNDRYNLKGGVKTKVNDSAAENNALLFKGSAKVHFK